MCCDRLATGNGLTKEIWADFQKRFGIDVIQEFYGATEGNGSFSNAVYLKGIMEGDMQGIGCVGRLIPGEKQRVRFIRYNVEEDSLVRDEKGNFVDCAVGEPGECLFPVKTKSAFTKFVGYTDPNATKKKIVKEGDTVYVRSGDLLSFDKDGWVRFIDRIGGKELLIISFQPFHNVAVIPRHISVAWRKCEHGRSCFRAVQVFEDCRS